MFTELMPLLRKRRLLLTIALIEGDAIRATVVPQKASNTEENALTTPLAITGTTEELDRDLPQQLVEFTGAHLQLQTTMASAKPRWMQPQKQLAKRYGGKDAWLKRVGEETDKLVRQRFLLERDRAKVLDHATQLWDFVGKSVQ